MEKQKRDNIYSKSPYNSKATSITPTLGRIISLLTLFPSVVIGCSDAELSDIEEIRREIGITLTKSPDAEGPLDIFVFDDDKMQRLDCYLRLDDFSQWKGGIISGSGSKIISAVAGIRTDIGSWTGITSRPALEGITVNLEDQGQSQTVMSAEAEVCPGTSYGPEGADAALELRPLVSEIVISSLSCDFTGRPYAGARLQDVKVYLTNVNAQCGLLKDGEIMPSRIINYGRLSGQDLEKFQDESIIYREIDGEIGKDSPWKEVRLRCFPNNAPEESPGTPFTRLVIEGTVDGKTFYWPIDINRTNGNGIDRNKSYCYDIRITRKGSTDPDTPVSTTQADIKFKIKEWEEKEECRILF